MSAFRGKADMCYCAARRTHVEASMPQTNEWNILRNQFDALTHDESVESIEDILDEEFRRRFAELIKQTAQRNSTSGYNWPRP